jgi:hypothetical protein
VWDFNKLLTAALRVTAEKLIQVAPPFTLYW